MLLLPIHLVCLVFTMARWDSGLLSVNPFNGSWHPAVGVTLPIIMATVAIAIQLVVYWRASRIETALEPAPTEEPVAVTAG